MKKLVLLLSLVVVALLMSSCTYFFLFSGRPFGVLSWGSGGSRGFLFRFEGTMVLTIAALVPVLGAEQASGRDDHPRSRQIQRLFRQRPQDRLRLHLHRLSDHLLHRRCAWKEHHHRRRTGLPEFLETSESVREGRTERPSDGIVTSALHKS